MSADENGWQSVLSDELMIENRAKCLLSLLLVLVFIHWASHAAKASWQTPKSAEEYNNRGLERQSSGDLDGAIADYTKALSLKTKPAVLATAYNNRAVALFEKGDLDGAIADYTRALQFEANDASIFYGRGTARQKKNDLDGALADYTKAIELDQTHALAYANRGVVKVLLQKSDASADFEMAFRLAPSLKATYNQFYEKRRKP